MKSTPFTFIYLIYPVILVFSCGSERKSPVSPSDPSPPYQLVQDFEVEEIPYNNRHCLESSASPGNDEQILANAPLFRWQNSTLRNINLDTIDLNINKIPLSSKYASKVTFGAVFRRSCNSQEADPPRCIKDSAIEPGWLAIAPGRNVKVCSPEDASPRLSIEQLALSATVAIETAGKALSQLIPELHNIAPLHVLVTPRFETHWTPWTMNGTAAKYESILADNLAYFPTYDQSQPFIAIFPKRKNQSSDFNLWESDFVVSHEFAHHVERSLNLDRFNRKRSTFRVGVSEGFADIMAYSILGASSASLRGIPCFGVDRAPDLSEFNTGLPKIISENLMGRVQPLTENHLVSFEVSAQCQGTTPSSAHGLGAIFAHAIFTISKGLPKFQESPDRVIAEVSIGWLRKIESTLPKDEINADESIKVIAKALEHTASQQFAKSGEVIPENIKELWRQKMRYLFPTITDHVWFQ